MKILIMRHGEAEMIAKSDQQRPLTAFGQQQSFQQANKLIKADIFPQYVLVSPYLRAQQTFQQVEKAFGCQLNMETWQGLTPYGDERLVKDYLGVLEQQGITTVLIISHLPLVGNIVNEFCPSDFISFYPATIVEIEWNKSQSDIINLYPSIKE
ncbi:phosphohistidine phosphatase SixA [Volucribacter psittacicida]|uniref:Phosphohistidine phosphatase SixA n=1 Tax=Volucribacter psittacicida TaxID=203482 RepID=A0A4V2PCJ9_9PAST|nr:phosphohistidine phosphatase SixA [Volucribacter psittacicida]TCK01516.1 phosphohistidine phosphatase SixA [Volucribacter psittacicida]